MTDAEAVPILARWNRELRYDLELANRRVADLETRCHRLEHAARQRALQRRHWIRNGHKERV